MDVIITRDFCVSLRLVKESTELEWHGFHETIMSLARSVQFGDWLCRLITCPLYAMCLRLVHQQELDGGIAKIDEIRGICDRNP